MQYQYGIIFMYNVFSLNMASSISHCIMEKYIILMEAEADRIVTIKNKKT